jgi:hypothetical protein
MTSEAHHKADEAEIEGLDMVPTTATGKPGPLFPNSSSAFHAFHTVSTVEGVTSQLA